jgi:hypothetical protein
MTPVASMRRMRSLNESAMKRLPSASTTTPWGLFSSALVATPPSSENPGIPVPATVVMMPVASTRRMRLLVVSAMKTLPSASAATPKGLYSWALVATPPSPENPGVPIPATVVMMPVASTRRMALLPRSAM